MTNDDMQLIETYWMLVLLINNLSEMGMGEEADKMSELAIHFQNQLDERHIDPNGFEMDITLDVNPYEDDYPAPPSPFIGWPNTSAFDSFVEGLDIDGGDA